MISAQLVEICDREQAPIGILQKKRTVVTITIILGFTEVPTKTLSGYAVLYQRYLMVCAGTHCIHNIFFMR